MAILKKTFSIIFRISISFVLLIFLFNQVDIKRLFSIMKSADLNILLLGFCIFSLNYIFCFLRWEMLLKAVKVFLPFKRVVKSYSGGIFFSLFLPSTIGGDFVRTVDLAVHTKKPSQIMATVILDRLSGFIGLVTVALLALYFGRSFITDKSVITAMGIITLILVAILLVLFNDFLYWRINYFLKSYKKASNNNKAGLIHRIRELLKETHSEIHHFRNNKKIILMNLGLSFIIQVISPLTFYFISLSLGIKLNVLYFFVFLTIIGAITLLPISIGGLGLRDAATIFFFAKVGVAKDMAFAMSLLNFIFILIYAGIGGIIYVLTVRNRRV
ncbi:MAG: lysylphosphatidylglycerol synthase transmembrane domain-containing protein [Candidatus Omnitrophica bacterium]|nr:lysylphosphatidylglycerol synthase transmembrane domain-containing protein [Candidatus Omnitrophota bacterium]